MVQYVSNLIQMIQIWYKFNTNNTTMMQIRYKMIQIWHKYDIIYDTNMTQIWYKYDTNRIKIWNKYDTNMIQIWYK